MQMSDRIQRGDSPFYHLKTSSSLSDLTVRPGC